MKKPKKPKAPKVAKKRAAPAFDASVAAIRSVHAVAMKEHWSPKRTRTALRKARNVCRSVWDRAVRTVFGRSVRQLPDLRQTSLWGDS